MELKYRNCQPQIHESCFIAEGVKLIGNVILKENSNIWYNAVLRGDIDQIVIGENSNVQDGTIIHCDIGQPTIIQKNVTIGHNAIIHGCTVEENSLIGMGAVIMNGVHIGRNSLIAAGTVIPPGRIIPENSLVMGNPGQVMRQVTNTDLEGMKKNTLLYVELAKEHKKQKTI
ncbi:gamma carbonic anhydrase family protein [Irregularibacter muris]|uniref:Gamma carbonic anhydrase family protein n=1 Tax=Irregularibacter muris TaxID=1796619 RepID=A0AAE3HD36_9FIRM|nr:gamma carbonic anhydrase family protein [Irregularibacter muris]MCR1898210.1 gamma carbonic anhydrase family protein [Irregularibacter muris]